MKITRDEYAKSYVIEVEGECYYWNPPAAPPQEPAFFVVTGKLGHRCAFTSTTTKKGDKVYPEPPDAAAQIESLKAQLEGAKVMYEAMSYKADTAAAQIAELKEQLKFCTESYGEATLRYNEQIATLQAENDQVNDAWDKVGKLDKRVSELQAENAELQRQLSDMHTKHPEDACYDVPTWNKLKDRIKELEAAARMTIDCWECEQMLTDAVLIQLHDALGDNHDL